MLNSTISDHDARPDQRSESANSAADHASILHLVPQSGVQIVDLALPVDTLDRVRKSFTEHRFASGAGDRSVLVAIAAGGGADAQWHPATRRALGPGDAISITGRAAIETYAGCWLPLPYFRIRGRDADGFDAFDAGPENWARIFISAPADPRSDPSLRVAVAFDARLMPAGFSVNHYLAPRIEDARLGARFKLATGAADLSGFAGRPWVDAWLKSAFARKPNGAASEGQRSHFALDHVARYCVLIDVLAGSGLMPEIGFIDTLDKSRSSAVRGVDLVLDVRSESTAALLVDREAASIGTLLNSALALAPRNLSDPGVDIAGEIPTQVEFAPPPFGDAGLSRLSGCPDAFQWPSLVRIGREAAALSLRPSAAAGVTGHAALTGLLEQTEASEESWRFSTDGDGVGPAVSGGLLGQVSEDGTPLAAHGYQRAAAVRPRFAPSSLMTFFFAELILHANSAINAVASASRTPGQQVAPGRLERIVASVAAGTAAGEGARLTEHLEQAVELVWRGLGWDGALHHGAPPRPEIVCSAGSEISAQMFRVRREIARRFAGEPGALLAAMGRATGPSGDPAIRIAGIELGGCASSATVVDYALQSDGALSPRQAIVDRWEGGGETVADAIAQRFVLPAVAAALLRSGIKAPELFLSRTLDATTARQSRERNLARRLRSKVIRPAAAAILEIARTLPSRVASGRRTYMLRDLVARGGGRLAPLAQELDALAAGAGAQGFCFERLEIGLSQRQLDRAVRSAVSGSLQRVAELVTRHDCDLALVSGPLSILPPVAEALIAELPLEPDRVVLADRPDGAPSAGNVPATLASLEPSRIAVLASAYLAERGASGLEAFRHVVATVGRDASRPMPLLAADNASDGDALADAVDAHAGTMALFDLLPRGAGDGLGAGET